VRSLLVTLRKKRAIPPLAALLAILTQELARLRQSRLQPVINATGVIIHTNLGRAPLADAVMRHVVANAAYNNLEFDLESGGRGNRGSYLEEGLAVLCQAEAATVVNNCAAALVLILRQFTHPPRDEVVISRGELIQIGGGFRIPEILESSGVRLREVGTTNRTTAADYARAVGASTALILKVHRSNFFMSGFVESPGLEELVQVARSRKVTLVEDLGSGALLPTEALAGIPHEPTPSASLRYGVDLCCFSGDKLLGGPQAGIIVGRAKWVAAIKKLPLFRALRCDKLVLSALQATVELYLEGNAPEQIPALQLLKLRPEELRPRAERLLSALQAVPARIAMVEGESAVGGGTLPEARLPTMLLEIQPLGMTAVALATALRCGTPPIIGKVARGRLQLDLRTVRPEEEALLVGGVTEALRSGRT
jgi:L-seryl-tRNA(Ser) seleniumtransferase